MYPKLHYTHPRGYAQGRYEKSVSLGRFRADTTGTLGHRALSPTSIIAAIRPPARNYAKKSAGETPSLALVCDGYGDGLVADIAVEILNLHRDSVRAA